MRSDGGRGRRLARTEGERCGRGTGGGDAGAGMRRHEMRRRRRERKWQRAGEDAGREMRVGPLNGPFPHSSHFMSTDLLFFLLF